MQSAAELMGDEEVDEPVIEAQLRKERKALVIRVLAEIILQQHILHGAGC